LRLATDFDDYVGSSEHPKHCRERTTLFSTLDIHPLNI
jgi:hypothetical protein